MPYPFCPIQALSARPGSRSFSSWTHLKAAPSHRSGIHFRIQAMLIFHLMVDLHHHLLPGLDDGSPDLRTSIEMAGIAEAEGITHVVCTPHASSRYTFDPQKNAALAAELREALHQAGIQLKLGLGCDFHLSYDNVQDALVQPARYSINEHDYLLVELPDFSISPNLGETFYELRLRGLVPILTHPERNPTLQRDPGRLLPWLREGLLCQITAGSVLGDMGREAERFARRMLKNRWVHFIATDSHNTTSRAPRMREAANLIAKRHGPEYAELICRSNPLAVFEGRPLGEHAMLGLEEEDEFKPANWWQRLMRM